MMNKKVLSLTNDDSFGDSDRAGFEQRYIYVPCVS